MSFQMTPAPSSRITKPVRRRLGAAFGLRRAASTTSCASPRKSNIPSLSSSKTIYDDDEHLDDTGVIASLADDLNFRNVPQFMEYIRNTMFSDLPEKTGMNSTRTAEVLNYRRNLSPFITIAHIHALTPSSTQVEREIAELTQAGILRRVTISNRGVGAAAVGDGIASMREWQNLVQSYEHMSSHLKEKYISVMNANPRHSTIPGSCFSSTEISELIALGLLTSSNTGNVNSSHFKLPGPSSLAAVASSGTRHAAGTLSAVGGVNAGQHIYGGISLSGSRPSTIAHYTFSLPNMGTFIRLLVDARSHLVNILKKTKYKEMPLDALRERWDGGVTLSTQQAERKKLRGEFTGVLPGKTKKWKQFYGMRFEWILEECLGAGVFELFETGSVGKAVRVL